MRSERATGAQQRGVQDDQLASTTAQPPATPANDATTAPADAQQYVIIFPTTRRLPSVRTTQCLSFVVVLSLQATPVQGCHCNGRCGASGWQV